MRAGAVAILLVGLAAAAFFLRALGLEIVFPGDGSTVFLSWDSYYHARRALFGLASFPSVLAFDPYLNFPDGAAVPWPPLYDGFLAFVAKLAGANEAGFDRTIAWVPPVLGALTTPLVYAAARAVGGRGLAFGAAAIFAVLPASSLQSSVGFIDHHAAVSLCATALLALALHAIAEDGRASRRAGLFAGLALARAAGILVWPGSSLFVVIVDGALLLAAAVQGRAALASAEAASALASAALVAPFALGAASPIGGAFSLVELSSLHALGLVALAAIAFGVAALERARPARGLAGALRLALLAALAGATLLAAVGLPGGGAGLVRFLGREDAWAAVNLEQVPLSQFSIPGGVVDGPMLLFGAFYYVAGLALVAVFLRAREASPRAPLLLLGVWTTILGLFAVRQVRFAVDFAPGAAVAFAILLDEGIRRLAPEGLGRRARAALAVGIGALLLAPAIYGIHVQRALFTHRYLVSGTLRVPDRALLTHEGTLLRFAERVRAATPETAGFLEPGGRPAYGITAFAGLGHVLHHVARRATPADNFGHYLGPENFFASQKVFELEDEATAVAELLRLRTPYVVTADLGGEERANLLHRLHRRDGKGDAARPRLERFRLVTEGPAGGQPIGTLFGLPLPPQPVPYKLFEVVPGAVLEVAAAPGAEVVAEITLETPLLRRVPYRASARAGADGRASLRVPYASEAAHPVRATGPWRVSTGGVTTAVAVSESDVREGRTVRSTTGSGDAARAR